MLRVTAVRVREDFHLEITFNNTEQRIIDMKKFLHGSEGLLNKIVENEQVFNSVYIDEISGALTWLIEKKSIDFDSSVIYNFSDIVL